MQRKLEQAKINCKKWCLDFKKEHKLEWEAITQELSDLENNLDQVEGKKLKQTIGRK